MARFERSRENKGRKESSDRSSRRGLKSKRGFEDKSYSKGGFKNSSGSRRSFDDKPRGSFKGRSNSRGNYDDKPRSRREYGSRNDRDFTLTKVTCSSCGINCEVPFKPTSSKPVYCNDCFSKNNTSSKGPNKDLEMINEKLDKIMKALKIE